MRQGFNQLRFMRLLLASDTVIVRIGGEWEPTDSIQDTFARPVTVSTTLNHLIRTPPGNQQRFIASSDIKPRFSASQLFSGALLSSSAGRFPSDQHHVHLGSIAA